MGAHVLAQPEGSPIGGAPFEIELSSVSDVAAKSANSHVRGPLLWARVVQILGAGIIPRLGYPVCFMQMRELYLGRRLALKIDIVFFLPV